MTTLTQGLNTLPTTSFRDYFDNFLWLRETTREVSLDEIGFKTTPSGAIDMSDGVDNLKFPLGQMVRLRTPNGMRVILLMTRLGPVGLYEFAGGDGIGGRMRLGFMLSTKIARHRFLRKAEGNEAQLEQLLLTFGFPERGIKNLHEQIEELAKDLADAAP